MGIYAVEKWEFQQGMNVAVHSHHVPGVTTLTVYQKVAEIEERDNCYCCSCQDDGYDYSYNRMDPYCRNHGFAGTRKCEAHDMPGDEYECSFDDLDTEDPTRPLLSVQAELKRLKDMHESTGQ